MGHTGIDEASLFHARDDLDRMSQGFAGSFEKRLLPVSHAQSIRADDTDTGCLHITQTLTKTLEAGNRTRRDLLVDAAILFNAGRKAHHLTETVNDDDLAVRVAGNDHVKTVRPEVNSS
jgi:hypothetical protein